MTTDHPRLPSELRAGDRVAIDVVHFPGYQTEAIGTVEHAEPSHAGVRLDSGELVAISTLPHDRRAPGVRRLR